MMDASVCQNIKGSKKARRCRNTATRKISVFQTQYHSRVANGWFWVSLCDPCFFASDSGAIVNMEGGPKWRRIKRTREE